MDEDTQKVHETTVATGDTVDKTTEVSSTSSASQHKMNVVERVIWFVASFIEVLLGTRFVLALLGANSTNTFADFINTSSRMFVLPFFTLFNYKTYFDGVSRFEGYTIVAMIVYLLVAAGIVKLVTITRK